MTQVRAATVDDMQAVNDIYNHYVANSAITFDEEPWPLSQRQLWFAKFADGPYELLISEHEDQVIGFAYTSAFRPKTAYNRSAEVTVYSNQQLAPKGAGTKLYEALLASAEPHFHRLYAVIALPNPGSLGLHAKLGFKEVGILNDVGYKFGVYHSVALLEKQLRL